MKTNLGLVMLFTFGWLVILFVLGNKEFASNYAGTDSTYPSIKYKEPILCSSPTAKSMLLAIQPIANGLWTDNAIWPNGIKPTANDIVVVPTGRTLTMVGTCFAKSIMVNGTLNAVNWQETGAWINLETESIMVNSGGKLEIGTETQPYYAKEKCIITLKGSKIDNAPESFKAIVVMGGGKIELHGKKRMSWTNIGTTANAGATQITLKQAVDWEIGDKIALTSTELAAGSATKAWEKVDEVEILNISADKKTLTLKAPLKYKHIGGSKSYTRARDGKKWDVNIFGEVGLLSHYIKIQGEMGQANETTGYGGHIMVMKNSTSHLEHVELYKMGQKGILGRYPFHWHLCEDTAQGSYFRNSSVHKSFNRAVTIHGTDYVTIDGIFAYDHLGHGIFLEDGGERFNTIKNNVVFLTRRPKANEQLTPSDNEANEAQNRTPASYWITNPNNYFENNVAAGTEGTGFWFAFPEKPMFASGNLPYFSGLNPTNQPLGRFDGFVAHTCMSGWDVFDQLNPNHSLKKNFGWNVSTPQLIKNGLLYGNDQAIYCGLGVNGENKNTVFYNCVFSDNKTATMLAGDLTIENSLFNADSDLGVFDGVKEFFRFYDGPGRHYDCHFEGWNRPNTEMIKQITGGGATENFNPTFRGTTKGFSEPFPFRFFALPNADETRTRTVGQFFKDYDGGLTGKAHTTIIRDIPFLRDGHEYRHPSWKNAARSDYYFASLWLSSINDSGTRMSIVRSKPGTQNVCFYESGSPSSGTYKVPMIVNQNFMYTHYFDRAPSSKTVHLIWNRGDINDVGFTCFKGLGKLGNFKVSGHNFTIPRLNSRSEVENATNTAYFIDANGDVYVKFKTVSNDPEVRVNVFFRWDNDGSFQPLALPCTTNDFTPIIVSNTPPALTFSSPTQTQYDEGTSLGVIVNATDSDGTIANVQLYLNNILVRQEGGAPYEWGTANPTQNDTALLNLVAGTYTLKAVATDNAGATTEVSRQITVKKKNTLPVVTFTSPAQSQYDEGASLGVVVNAADSDGTIANVQLFLNNVIVRQEGVAPYEWGTANAGQNDAALLNLVAGTYTFKAVATDNVGGTSEVTKQITIVKKTTIVQIVKRNVPYAIDGNNGGADNQNVYIWSSNASNVNQQWIEIDRGNGYYSYQKMNTNYCIDGGNGGANNQNVYLWTCGGDNQNQHWKKINMGSGYFRLEKRNAPGYTLDGGAGGANGQNLKLFSFNNTNVNQHWSFTSINSTSISSRLEEETFSIYPNPVIDVFTFDVKDSAIGSKSVGKIYDNSGLVVKSFEIDASNPSISLEELKAGIYLLYIEGKNRIYSTKIIKQ